MATSFLSSSDRSWFEEAADTWFETFKKSITVNKEPIKNIVQNTTNQMLGYDENSIRSTKKRIELLYFDPNGKPIFGGDFFTFKQDSIPQKNQSRFWVEYKKNGNARIIFDDELNLIIYDHLISETNEPNKLYTYIPDGDYEGFKWTNGKWLHINKVFNQKLKDGEAPIIKPIKENKIKSGS